MNKSIRTLHTSENAQQVQKPVKDILIQEKGIDLFKLYNENYSEFKEVIYRLKAFGESFRSSNKRLLKKTRSYNTSKFEKLDSSDYYDEEYDYDTKTEAKNECKKQIKNAIENAISNLNDEISNIIDYYQDAIDSIDEYLDEFCESYLDIYDEYEEILFDCTEDPDVKKQSNEFREKLKALKMLKKQEFTSKPDERIEALRKSWKKYWDLCDYDDDDDSYCYLLSDAVDEIQDDVESILEDFADDMESLCDAEDLLDTKLDELCDFVDDRVEEICEQTMFDEVIPKEKTFIDIVADAIYIKADVLKTIFTPDIGFKGKEEGYALASDIYAVSFRKVQSSFNGVKKFLKKVTEKYDCDFEEYLAKLERAENPAQAELGDLEKELDALKRDREKYRKEAQEKEQAICLTYNYSSDALADIVSAKNRSVWEEIVFSHDLLYLAKKKKYYDGIQEGFDEAQEAYEIKINKLKDSLYSTISRGTAAKNKYAALILDLINDIIDIQSQNVAYSAILEVGNGVKD